jgi:hypothetical protein
MTVYLRFASLEIIAWLPVDLVQNFMRRDSGDLFCPFEIVTRVVGYKLRLP